MPNFVRLTCHITGEKMLVNLDKAATISFLSDNNTEIVLDDGYTVNVREGEQIISQFLMITRSAR